MSADSATPQSSSLLTPLLGMVLLLVAGLNIALLTGIGWATWQRATLSERWFQMRREDSLLQLGAQPEAQGLQQSVAAAHESALGALHTFPTDADIARHVSVLQAEAVAAGLSVTELAPQPMLPTTVPVRRFLFRLQGEPPQLVAFLGRAAELSLPTGRLEEVSLLAQTSQGELSFELLVAVRPVDPLAAP